MRPDASGVVAVGVASYVEGHGGGLNRFCAEIAPALLDADPRATVVTASAELARRYAPRSRRMGPPAMAASNFRGNLMRMVWHQTALPAWLRRSGAAAFYSAVPEGMLSPVCPQVVTVHDVLPLLYPAVYPRLQYYFQHVVPRVLRASAAIVAVSEATRRDVERRFALGDTPVHVVYQGYRSEVFRRVATERAEEARRKHGLGRFLLTVGESREYKNIRRLVEAFAEASLGDVQLAVVGRAHDADPVLAALPTALGVERRVRFLGYVPDDDLAALYGAAEALVFPSEYEGFGIPPLEAMACGCPVVSSNGGALPEVCGEAAVYVDPLSTASIARGMAEVVADGSLRQRLRCDGLERVARFSYSAAAAQVAAVLDSVLR